MREYAKVAPQFWIGKTGREIRKLGPEAVAVAMYLMTCQHSNMIGLYYLPIAFLAHDTGLPIEAPSKGLARGFKVARETLRSLERVGFCRYDEQTEVVWVFEMARFQIADQMSLTDKRRKGVANLLQEVPFSELCVEFIRKYRDEFKLHSDLLDEGASKGLQRAFEAREQEQEKRTESRNTPPTPPSGEDDDFETQAEQVARLHPEDQELFWLWKRRQQRLAIRYHAEGAYTDAELARQLELLDYDHPAVLVGVDHRLANERLSEERFRPIWSEERNRVTYLRSPEDAPDGFLPRDPWDERVEARLATN